MYSLGLPCKMQNLWEAVHKKYGVPLFEQRVQSRIQRATARGRGQCEPDIDDEPAAGAEAARIEAQLLQAKRRVEER